MPRNQHISAIRMIISLFHIIRVFITIYYNVITHTDRLYVMALLMNLQITFISKCLSTNCATKLNWVTGMNNFFMSQNWVFINKCFVTQITLKGLSRMLRLFMFFQWVFEGKHVSTLTAQKLPRPITFYQGYFFWWFKSNFSLLNWGSLVINFLPFCHFPWGLPVYSTCSVLCCLSRFLQLFK